MKQDYKCLIALRCVSIRERATQAGLNFISKCNIFPKSNMSMSVQRFSNDNSNKHLQHGGDQQAHNLVHKVPYKPLRGRLKIA